MRPSVCYMTKSQRHDTKCQNRKHSRVHISCPSASALRLKRPVEDNENITLNVEHCRFQVLARKIVVEDIIRAVWPVVKPIAHCDGSGRLHMSECIPGIFGAVQCVTNGPSTLAE
jgi:hypothetical protein